MEVIKVEEHQLAVLQEISRVTFIETYAQANTEADMQAYLAAHFSIEQLQKELQNPASYFYFIQIDKQVVGYLKLNVGEAQTETQEVAALEIERIYILKSHQGKQLGQRLHEKAVQIAKQKKVNYLWLGVWEKNPKAIGFYQRMGFVAYDKHFFKLGDDLQTDLLMKLEL